MSCCTQYTINDNLFEASGNYAIILGNGGNIFSNWMEIHNIAPIKFQASGGTVTSSSNTFTENIMNEVNPVVIGIPDGCTSNVFINNLGGSVTFLPAASSAIPKIIGGFGNPTVPTITRTSGATGTLTLISASLYLNTTYLLFYRFTATSAPSDVLFAINSQTGYSPAQLIVSAYNEYYGTPINSSVQYPLNAFVATIPNTSAHILCVQVTYP